MDFVDVLQTALAADKAVLAMRGMRELPSETVFGTIDIWWMIHDGGFLILLSWLLVQHKIWRQCHMRVFTITEGVTEEQAKDAAELLTNTLRDRRLFDVDVEVILIDDDMIEPYTHDWTLREEERHRFLNELNQSRGGVGHRAESIPLEVDDLFHMAQDNKKAKAKPKGRARQAADEKTNSEQHRPRKGTEDSVSTASNNGAIVQGASAATLPSVAEHTSDAAASQAGSPAVAPGQQNILEQRDRTESKNTTGSTMGVAISVDGNASDKEDQTKPGRRERKQAGYHHKGSKETWAKFNNIIHSRSKRAQLVVMNLPDIWGTDKEQVKNYMEYCDCVTEGLHRVLFVHSSGHEVFDIQM